jgi:uncharacterized Zn ribbon protein
LPLRGICPTGRTELHYRGCQAHYPERKYNIDLCTPKTGKYNCRQRENVIVVDYTVATIKDLKAGKVTIKSGTKVKNIRLLDAPVNGHDISCKIKDFGAMYLKCSIVKKA